MFMLETINTTKASFINRMMARNNSCNSDFIALATEKNRPVTVKEVEKDLKL